MSELPLVIAYHLIWTAYGWWLPNDPRGSMSRSVAFDHIGALGELHFGRKRVQPSSIEIREFYDRAKSELSFELLQLDPAGVECVAQAFAEVVQLKRYTCYACAIMPDHVHLLIRKHKDPAEEMISHFQDTSRLRLRQEKHRKIDHPVWGGTGWKVFLDHPDDIRRTIRYVEDNPIKAGLSQQIWTFVKPYDGWPLHPGHSPNSPYARRLREN